MTFDQFKILARRVFPALPSHFEALPDERPTYDILVRCVAVCQPQTDRERMDLFSVSNMTFTQIRHLQQFGETYWD